MYHSEKDKFLYRESVCMMIHSTAISYTIQTQKDPFDLLLHLILVTLSSHSNKIWMYQLGHRLQYLTSQIQRNFFCLFRCLSWTTLTVFLLSKKADFISIDQLPLFPWGNLCKKDTCFLCCKWLSHIRYPDHLLEFL